MRGLSDEKKANMRKKEKEMKIQRKCERRKTKGRSDVNATERKGRKEMRMQGPSDERKSKEKTKELKA